MDSQHERSENNKKRKKKRSHVQMAKKFARQRNHGHDLDAETYQYMVRILELMRDGFPSAEEKLLFVNNVYEQTVGHEIEYARNQIGSRVLDSLLRFASLEAIQRLVDAFSGSFRLLSNDRFASHVLQKIIVICADRGNRGEEKSGNVKPESPDTEEIVEIKEADIKVYNDITLKLCRYLLNNIEEFVFDTYANHVLRTAFECLGGLIDRRKDEGKKKTGAENVERRHVVEEYKSLLVQSSTRLHKWPQFLEFCHDELTSGLLQSVLFSLKDIDAELTETYVKKITKECFKLASEEKLSNAFDTESSLRVLEACLMVSSSESCTDIYMTYFKGNLKELSLTQKTNFSVQRLLDYCNTKENIESIFDELSEHFSEILEKRHTGILVSIANACRRVQTKQGPFVNAIMKMLGCDASPEKQQQIVICACGLKVLGELDCSNQNFPTHLHGSLIVQAMLHFNKPIKIVNSILEMDKEKLVYLFSDSKGSRIADAFMESKYIGEKSREKLAKRIQGCWAQLAMSTHGSRSLDKMWLCASSKQRLFIMEELAAAGESLRSTKSGTIIATKLNVPLFARSKKDWTELQGKEEKTRALFANIIGDVTKKK